MTALEFALSILTSLLAAELYVWFPRIAAWLVQYQVSRLPEHLRDRYRDEWAADLAAQPGNLSKIAFAVPLFQAVRRIGNDVEAQSRGETQDLLSVVVGRPRLVSRFALLLAAAAVTPLLAYGGISIYSLHRGTRTTVTEGNIRVTQRAAELIQLYVTSRVKILKVVAADLDGTASRAGSKIGSSRTSCCSFASSPS